MGRIRGFGAGGPRHERLELPTDPMGFVRRECASCHRLFKARASALDGALVLQRVVGRTVHQNGHEAREAPQQRFCPYCGARAPADAWFTAEQRAWLDKRADTLGLEVRYEQLAHIERTLADNPGPTFLPVRPEMPECRLRPERDDMRCVPLLCCSEELKISDNWLGAVRCFYCGWEHELGAVLIRERLPRLLDPS